MTRTRQPIKPLNPTSASTAANAAAEKARKAASKKALKAAKEPAVNPRTTAIEALNQARLASESARVARQAEDAANALRTAKTDAEATGVTLEDMAAEMGIDPLTGAPSLSKSGVEVSTYSGPMLALRARAKAGVYTKMANGNPSCNDWLARDLGTLTREQVVKALILAMKLPHNPYAHLNPGQQSMNLRNKARGMVKNGTLTQADTAVAINTTVKGV
jgi:hypothetical protein